MILQSQTHANMYPTHLSHASLHKDIYSTVWKWKKYPMKKRMLPQIFFQPIALCKQVRRYGCTLGLVHTALL